MLPLAVLSTGRGLALDLVEEIFVLAVARDQRPLSLVLPHDEFEMVPSSFLREATSLFHSPTSKSRGPGPRSTATSPSDAFR